jgi:hypothetical protein
MQIFGKNINNTINIRFYQLTSLALKVIEQNEKIYFALYSNLFRNQTCFTNLLYLSNPGFMAGEIF